MTEPQSLPELAQLTAVFRRAARVRTRETVLRGAMWLWLCVALVWLLPVGPWSATAQQPAHALLCGAVLALGGAGLLVLHRAVIRTAGMRAMLDDARELAERAHL